MKKFYLVLLLTFVCTSMSMAQRASFREMQSKADRFFGPPVFLYDIFFFKSPTDITMTKTMIHIGFCNDILQFVKSFNNSYNADYELVVAIFDKKGNQLNSKTFSNSIIVKSFAETNLRKTTNRISHSVDLVADEYKLTIDLSDLDTKKTLHREKMFKVHQFKFDKVGLSDIIFADKIEKEADEIKAITSNLNRNFHESESDFSVYFEIYPVSLNDSLTMRYEILDANARTIVRREKTFIPDKLINSFIINIGDQISQANRYVFNVEVKQKGNKDKRSGKFSTSWSYFEIAQLNIEQAIKPLINHVESKDWKSIEQASDSVKEAWFYDYWRKRDPSPETEENELMDEFYDRVEFANFYFTVNTLDKDGWQTDRGKIYIKYGPPTSVDRHISDLNVPPYEIWFFSNLERRFIFEDRSGYGDYNLIKIE